MSSISIRLMLGPLPFAALTHRSAGDDTEFVVQKYFLVPITRSIPEILSGIARKNFHADQRSNQKAFRISRNFGPENKLRPPP
jgi:hypothetical protein